ncbi:hypothetical protein GCM10022223_53700 [Kineosporia mesophila]|uniref:Uncharacterized protein n=1 Tax=Kineosporia mesophila TaxID=566012 RepID=A0ABP7ACI6_9ACTN
MRIDKDGGLVTDDVVPAGKDHWLGDCEDQAFADYFKTLW